MSIGVGTRVCHVTVQPSPCHTSSSCPSAGSSSCMSVLLPLPCWDWALWRCAQGPRVLQRHMLQRLLWLALAACPVLAACKPQFRRLRQLMLPPPAGCITTLAHMAAAAVDHVCTRPAIRHMSHAGPLAPQHASVGYFWF